jgi:UPF0716 protein FxsA
MPLFWIYLLVELAAVVGLAYAVGLGWTLLILLATFILGLALAGSQIKRQIRRLRAGLNNPHGAISDGVLVALGTLLVVIPGLVTSALGALLLLPPTRAIARPLLTAAVIRRIPLVIVPTRHDYIDGEVVDVVEVEQRALPDRPS